VSPEHDHAQYVPIRHIALASAPVTASSPEVCKTVGSTFSAILPTTVSRNVWRCAIDGDCT
jgi:hypothetical protein